MAAPFSRRRCRSGRRDNGFRFMIFPDNRRTFVGDFVIECERSIDDCPNPTLLPVTYPAEVADGPHISHRWSEMIVAPDGRHIAWTTLLSNYSALVLTGALRRQGVGCVIAEPRIVSTLDPFEKDPRHADGVLPQAVRSGEVKQFVAGGTGISLVGGTRHDLADSVIHHLSTGEVEAITATPGYDETTIVSPDGRLGVVMTTRFSPTTDMAVLALMPRPYPDGMNMGLNRIAYTYGVTGVRAARIGNIGPALVEIGKSKDDPNYLGVNLNADEKWVFRSPISWHPSGRSALWVEGVRQGGPRRVQIVRLLDYRPGPAIAVRPTPADMSYAVKDMSVVKRFAAEAHNVNVKAYGKRSGYVTYRRTPAGVIEKTYVDFSDDGRQVYNGSERMTSDPRGRSTYTAKIQLTGPKPEMMDLQMTFGPLGGDLPARIIFAPDASGRPLSYGYTEYGGRRLEVSRLVP